LCGQVFDKLRAHAKQWGKFGKHLEVTRTFLNSEQLIRKCDSQSSHSSFKEKKVIFPIEI